MAATLDILLLILVFTSSAFASFFEIQYPNVLVTAETGGNLTIAAGPQGGNIFMKPIGNGTVYIGKTDMLKLFEVLNSMPPVWDLKSIHGSLGTFRGGSTISVLVKAIDPEGGKLSFMKVSGALPPGVHLDKTTGRISGTAPDVDATYEFGIRVTDVHGKYADQIFSIDTREMDQCLSNPCQHGGNCTDDIDGFICSCTATYGGPTCQKNCLNEAIGVDTRVKKIPDAQLSAHYSFGDHAGTQGRLNAPQGWVGINTASWLQVDMGQTMNVYAVATQGETSNTYYTTAYYVSHSTDGNTFSNVLNGSSTMTFSGSSSVNSVMKQTFPLPVQARYIRFIPRTYNSHPGMRVEIYGCPVNS